MSVAQQRSRLADAQKREQQLLQELDSVRAIIRDLNSQLGLDELPEMIRQNEEALDAQRSMDQATVQFEKSLQQPPDYDNEELPYCDTDEYADFSILDDVTDIVIEQIAQHIDTATEQSRLTAVLLAAVLCENLGKWMAAYGALEGAELGELLEVRDSVIEAVDAMARGDLGPDAQAELLSHYAGFQAMMLPYAKTFEGLLASLKREHAELVAAQPK